MSKTQSHTNTLDVRYQNAAKLHNAVGDIRNLVLNTAPIPQWIEDHYFWYRRETRLGDQFRLVNAKIGSNQPAFHHQALAIALSEATGENVCEDQLPITKVKISLSPKQVTFEAFGRAWSFLGDEDLKPLQARSAPSKDLVISPDGTKGAFVRDYNLWVRDLSAGEERALTIDGREFFEYACGSRAWGIYSNFYGVEARWSPDSKYLFSYQVDNRLVKSIPIVRHVPLDGSLRPTLMQPRVALKGDEHVETSRIFSIDVSIGEMRAANYPPVPSTRSAHGLFVDGLAWWGKDSQMAYFIDSERGSQVVRVVEFNTHTGATRILFEESSNTVVRLSLDKMDGAMLLPLPDSQELIWFSERSGWGHLYLYDLRTGELKHPITQGEWLVRKVLHFDSAKRELWIQTGGREDGCDPYYLDICRVNIDTGDITTLVSNDTNYTVLSSKSEDYLGLYSFEMGDPMVHNSGVSPQSDYVVTTHSRVDQLPVTLVLDRDGNTLLELEAAENIALPPNWQSPEPVQLTAADGQTAIYGVVFRPSDFSPDQHYPVIDCSKCNPEADGVPKSFNGTLFLWASSLAELGFITVLIDGRGTIYREKSFADASHGWYPACNMIEDRIAGIKQLAQRYSYIDLNHVGTIGFLSNQSAVIGMLVHPEFYHVGVSHGVTDAQVGSVLNSEHFEGTVPYKGEYKRVEDMAANLQGKLMLMHGMHNAMTPPAGTFRLVEALHKANKDFDLLLLPNDGDGEHIGSKYAFRRTWDYFVQHLQGTEPPKEFNMDSVSAN